MTRRPASARRRATAGLAVSFAMAWLAIDPADAARHRTRHAAPSATATQAQRAAREQAALTERLKTLKDEIARAEAGRSEARDALRASEAAISDANRTLAQLAHAQSEAQAKLRATLDARSAAQRDADTERERLAELIRAQALVQQRPPWVTVLLGGDPNDAARQQIYARHLVDAEAQSIRRLDDDATRLSALATQVSDRNAALDAIVEQQRTQRETLTRERARRETVLRTVSAQIAAQRRAADALERDAKRLNALVDRLTTLLADETRRNDEARRRRDAEARRATREAQKHPDPAVRRRATPPEDDASPAGDVAGQDFSALRGHLHWPTQGDLANRFGQPRDNHATWKGVFIRAAAGAPVRAVAAGRVVFADWLRGFGNLLIVDHGHAYLSVYGNNETLLKSAGDAVAAGEDIATVGATGGAESPGLYFELRHKGDPFDPVGWVR